MATTPNIYEEMKKALKDFDDFLTANTQVIKGAVKSLAALIPQINDLLTQLIGVLKQIQTKISQLNVNVLGADVLGKVSTFTQSIITLLDASKILVPDLTSEIATVMDTAKIVTSLPSLTDIKAEIDKLLTNIIKNVGDLKSA